MGVWSRPGCVWVSEATAANLHSLNQTGRQQRRSGGHAGKIHTHTRCEEVGGMEGNQGLLTKRCNDGTRDAVGHADGEDAHGPGVLQAELELVGLALRVETQTHL